MTAADRLILRANAAPGIGSGHAMRMVALGEEWARDGLAELHTTELTPWMIEEATERGIAVVSIEVEVGGREDAQAVLRHAEPETWIVIDGYDFRDHYRREFRTGRVAVVDDHAITAPYSAELVVDQNVGASRSRYEAVAKEALLLLGPRYALLRSEFRALRPAVVTDNVAPTIVVSLGGFPSRGARELIKGATELLTADMAVDVLSGRARDAPRRMARATVAVSTAGTVVSELACLGVPAILIATADNQVPVAERIAARGAGLNLGWWEGLNPESVARAIADLVFDRGHRLALATRAHALVDGMGAERVVSALRAPPVRLREASESDGRLLWEWANDPVTRKASFNPGPIPWDTHVEWLTTKLSDPKARMYVVSDTRGTPIAQIRFDADKANRSALEVGVSVASVARGRGYGVAVLLAGVERVRRDTGVEAIVGVVKDTNTPSLRAFERAGFADIGRDRVHGSSVVRFCHTESS